MWDKTGQWAVRDTQRKRGPVPAQKMKVRTQPVSTIMDLHGSALWGRRAEGQKDRYRA